MNVPAIRTTRLPMPSDAGVDAGQWRVLVEAIFPNARSSDAVVLALNYCKARGLDVMKKPVNIVPIWNSQLGREVETVWPSINEIQVTAARTGQWAGMDPPAWGPTLEQEFTGRRKTKQGWQDAAVTVTFPESCSVTVYRKIDGTRCAFTEPVFWIEAYGRVGGSTLPNDMWVKRPRGQLLKVAKATSLRAAFPEEGDYSADEMEGTDQAVAADVTTAPVDAWRPPDTIPDQPGGPPGAVEPDDDVDPDTGEIGPRPIERSGDDEPWRDWCARLLDHIRKAPTLADVDKWEEANADTMTACNTAAPKVHVQLKAAIGRHRVTLAQPKQGEPKDDQQQPGQGPSPAPGAHD
jgi:phage recombination protein Bet